MTTRGSILALSIVAACGDGGGATPDAGPVPDAGPLEGTWRSLTALSAPRQEHAVVAIGDRVYVIGGLDANEDAIGNIEVLDLATGQWSVETTMPPMHHVNAAALGGKIYILGALFDDWRPFPTVRAYDPATRQWTGKRDMPDPRGAAAVGVVGERIFVAGGLTDFAVATASVYDTRDDTWAELPGLPERRDHTVGAGMDGVFHVFGGRVATLSSVRAVVWAYDEAGRRWVTKTPMPTARGGASGAVVGSRYVVCGGEGNRLVLLGVFAECEAYDPALDRWWRLPPMPVPRHGMGAAGVGDELIIPGGATMLGFVATTTVEALRLPP
jgi:N-acetylneuraminic acid mutarotase